MFFRREARRTHVQLIKDRKTFDRKIEEMEEQCNELMVGKFGRIVDLEKLETITVNRTIEELKEKMRNTEMKCSEELSRFDVSVKLGLKYVILYKLETITAPSRSSRRR